ncbi:MAG: chorismate-binding protein, partial [Verrucomicrobiales bacterium]
GWWNGEEGVIGATPESLFRLRRHQLETMALAGTARREERDVFCVDEKEIREHEFVAQSLISKLSDLGMVRREVRQVLDLGQLVHFQTLIKVELYRGESIDRLVERLHPTPALGPLPRTAETMRMAVDWRERLQCPEVFGAPFGLLHEGEFQALVGIRMLRWQGRELFLPSGCGIIEESRLVNEWRELRLKREAVRESFALAR